MYQHTQQFDLMFIAVVARDADTNGAVFDEVHAVGGVSLPDYQLAVDQGAGEQCVRQVSALIWLLIDSFINIGGYFTQHYLASN